MSHARDMSQAEYDRRQAELRSSVDCLWLGGHVYGNQGVCVCCGREKESVKTDRSGSDQE